MPYATINGVRLHYEVSGSGPTVVWLHGALNSIERSRAAGEGVDDLSLRGFRAVQYDARGHGKSDGSTNKEDYSWDTLADEMCGLLDALDIERASIGGGSMGAAVSITFALRHAERVDKLVLLVPPPLADTIETAQQVFGGLVTLIESVGLDRAVEIVLTLPEYVEMKRVDPQRHARMSEWLRGLRTETAPAAVRGLLFGTALPEERFGEIRAPALIIGQPDDLIHPLSTAHKLHEAVAHSQLVIAPEFDYYRTHHDELIDTIALFLGAASAAK